MTILQEIQRLQYRDVEAANALLATFIAEVFAVEVASVELRPLAVSLNSFNGFVTLTGGRRLFFKSHVEPGSVISEYYNSDLMVRAGYPVIRPVKASTEPGRQILLYEVVDDESVFDAAWAIERGERRGGFDSLANAQQNADDELLRIYTATLEWKETVDHAQAPIHQLFHHRLVGGRLDEFYGTATHVSLPDVGSLTLSDVRSRPWTINGVRFDETLDDLIARAVRLLRPGQAGPAVVGHGDAHNGNVFLHNCADGAAELVYFDPAFAGVHDPLLDLVKPFYHNVHAMWMYFPGVIARERGASLAAGRGGFDVTYPQTLHPVRDMFWESKTERVLIPLLRDLKAKGWLRDDWREYLQAALTCCPLLTMNLADGERFPPEVALLGLAHVMVMGGSSLDGSSPIEMWLNDVEAAL